MEYTIVYKCQICGALIRYGEPQEVSYELLPEVCGKVIQNQQFAGNPYLHKAPMHIVHKCRDYNCGIANFAGLVQCDKNK